MKYQGGKGRIARRLMESIGSIVPPDVNTWVEPFVGGAWMLDRAYDSDRFEHLYAGDAHEDLILLYQAIARGWNPPDEVSRELYFELKKAEPSPLRGFAGFGSAYGGNWFTGYCGDVLNGKKTNAQIAAGHLRRRAWMLGNVVLQQCDYRDWEDVIDERTVVYCDPPYAGTIGYSGAKGGFDSEEFWVWCARMATERNAHVFVSEYSGPGWADVVWSRTARQTISAGKENHTVTDALYYIEPASSLMAAAA